MLSTFSRHLAGTLDDARLTGSYTFEHIVLTSNQTAQIISANANASHLTTGLIDPGRLTATDYDDVGILTILDSLVASVVDAVLDADELVSGIVPDALMKVTPPSSSPTSKKSSRPPVSVISV